MNEFYNGLADIFEVDPAKISATSSLAELGWDSLAMVSTIALFDEVYDKPVSIGRLEDCKTVGDIEALAAE